MTDSANKPNQSPTSWFHDDAPHGPTRLTNYALMRNLIGQTITAENLVDAMFCNKIISVVDIDGDEWTRADVSGFELFPGAGRFGLFSIDQARGPLTITGVFSVPDREAEELLVIQRERSEFDLAQRADGADPKRKFQSAMEAQKFHWNHAWPVGSRVQYEYDTNIVWRHTVSPAYWYADQLVVDLCTGRKAVPVGGLAMRDGAEVEVEKWNENHGTLAYEIEYIGATGEWIKTKARTMAYVEGQRALIQTTEGSVISIGRIYKSETKADVAEKMAKLKADIAHQMKHDHIMVIPPPGYDGITPRMGMKEYKAREGQGDFDIKPTPRGEGGPRVPWMTGEHEAKPLDPEVIDPEVIERLRQDEQEARFIREEEQTVTDALAYRDERKRRFGGLAGLRKDKILNESDLQDSAE